MNIIKKYQLMKEENQRLRNHISGLKAMINAMTYRNSELIKSIKLLIEKKELLEVNNKYNLEIIAELYSKNKYYTDVVFKDIEKTFDLATEIVEKEKEHRKLTVVIVEQGKEPCVSKIMNSCDDFDRITEGRATSTTDDDLPDMAVICNENKGISKLRMNRIIRTDKHSDYIMGTFIVVGIGERDFVSLTDEQIEKVKTRFALKKDIKKEPT